MSSYVLFGRSGKGMTGNFKFQDRRRREAKSRAMIYNW